MTDQTARPLGLSPLDALASIAQHSDDPGSRWVAQQAIDAARAASPSDGLGDIERLRRIEHAARDVDGLWSESRTLIHWEQEAGEALRDLRAALEATGEGA